MRLASSGVIRSCTTLRTAVPTANSYFGMENRSGVWFITPRCPNPKLFLEVFIHGKML